MTSLTKDLVYLISSKLFDFDDITPLSYIYTSLTSKEFYTRYCKLLGSSEVICPAEIARLIHSVEKSRLMRLAIQRNDISLVNVYKLPCGSNELIINAITYGNRYFMDEIFYTDKYKEYQQLIRTYIITRDVLEAFISSPYLQLPDDILRKLITITGIGINIAKYIIEWRQEIIDRTIFVHILDVLIPSNFQNEIKQLLECKGDLLSVSDLINYFQYLNYDTYKLLVSKMDGIDYNYLIWHINNSIESQKDINIHKDIIQHLNYDGDNLLLIKCPLWMKKIFFNGRKYTQDEIYASVVGSVYSLDCFLFLKSKYKGKINYEKILLESTHSLSFEFIEYIFNHWQISESVIEQLIINGITIYNAKKITDFLIDELQHISEAIFSNIIVNYRDYNIMKLMDKDIELTLRIYKLLMDYNFEVFSFLVGKNDISLYSEELFSYAITKKQSESIRLILNNTFHYDTLYQLLRRKSNASFILMLEKNNIIPYGSHLGLMGSNFFNVSEYDSIIDAGIPLDDSVYKRALSHYIYSCDRKYLEYLLKDDRKHNIYLGNEISWIIKNRPARDRHRIYSLFKEAGCDEVLTLAKHSGEKTLLYLCN